MANSAVILTTDPTVKPKSSSRKPKPKSASTVETTVRITRTKTGKLPGRVIRLIETDILVVPGKDKGKEKEKGKGKVGRTGKGKGKGKVGKKVKVKGKGKGKIGPKKVPEGLIPVGKEGKKEVPEDVVD